MDCELVREALSARLDGEVSGVDGAAVDAHLRVCPGCRGWLRAAEDLTRRVRVRAGEGAPAGLASSVLAATAGPTAPSPHRRARLGLAAVAAVQLALAAESVVVEEAGHAHQLHELGAWDAALAVGFLAAAWRPARAWGMLPLVAAVVLALAVTTIADMAAGNATMGREIAHVLAVVGLALLRQLAAGGRPTLRAVRAA